MKIDIELIEFNAELLALIELELQRAKARFPNRINSFHEGYGIILEEFDELWDEIKKNETTRSPAMIQSEGIHVIITVIRMLQDLIIEAK
jgi:restriction endonuclease S subunit